MREKLEKIQGKIMPRPMKRLEWETEKSKHWFVEYAGNMLYEVTHTVY